MIRNHYARKRRQLKGLSKKLQLLSSKKEHDFSKQINGVVLKIKKLLRELTGSISSFDMKNLVGVTAIGLSMFLSGNIYGQTFEAPVENPFGLTSVPDYAIPKFVDLDGDGDLDILAADYYADLYYFENTGTSTSPAFAAPLINPFGLTPAIILGVPACVDLDGDGDYDVVVGDYAGQLNYFENIGTSTSPQFAASVQNPFGLDSTNYFAAPVFADIDNDGDYDLFVGQTYAGIAFFENTGTATNPSFAAPVNNPFGLNVTNDINIPTLGDLDNDGDLDLLIGEYYGEMAYYENTGTASAPQFAMGVNNPFNLTATTEYAVPTFGDLDDDGDLDLLVGQYPGSMVYFKNNLITSVKEAVNVPLKLYPNPVIDLLNLVTDQKIDKLEIFNVLGQSVQVFKSPSNQINITDLSSGFYSLKCNFSSGEVATYKINKQ